MAVIYDCLLGFFKDSFNLDRYLQVEISINGKITFKTPIYNGLKSIIKNSISETLISLNNKVKFIIYDNMIKVYKYDKYLYTINIEKNGYSLDISPNEKYFIISYDLYFSLYELENGNLLYNETTGYESSYRFSLEGNYLIINFNNQYLLSEGRQYSIIYSIKDEKIIYRVDGDYNFYPKILISENEKYLTYYDIYYSRIEIIELINIENIYKIYINEKIIIDNNGYFKATYESINNYLRINDDSSYERTLTIEEINHFRKKGNFWEIGEILEKPKVEERISEIDIDDILF
jgi:hypothetical protein